MANRTIKFRAWDKTNNRFVFARLEKDGWHIVDDIRNCGELSDWEQYTGLKDKNGKEIWEGDIVKFGAQLGSVAEVKWLIKNAGFLVKDKWGDWQWLYDVVASTNCEIIGNIYENPDLLEAKDE